MAEDGMHFCSRDAGLIGSFLVTTLDLGPAFPSFFLVNRNVLCDNLLQLASLQALKPDELLNAKRPVAAATDL